MGEAVGLSKRREAWAERGIGLLGLGLDEAPDACERFFEQTGGRATYPLYRAPWVGRVHDVQAVPTLLVFDAAGDVVFRAEPVETPDPLAALDDYLAARPDHR